MVLTVLRVQVLKVLTVLALDPKDSSGLRHV
jgi:hypothetical protein